MRVSDLMFPQQGVAAVQLTCRVRFAEHDSRPIPPTSYLLEDFTGQIEVAAENERANQDAPLPEGVYDLVVLPATPKGPFVPVILSASLATDIRSADAAALLALPTYEDGLFDTHLAFYELVSTITEPVLDRFVSKVLQVPLVAARLTRARASSFHHHAHIGGLLAHTVEVIKTVASLAEHKGLHHSHEIQLYQVGALLHDLGKVITHDVPADPFGQLARHEQMVSELVGPALLALAEASPVMAAELREVLAWGGMDPQRRRRSPSVVAELVALADQCSAICIADRSRLRHQSVKGT